MSRVENMFGPREDWGKGGEMDRVRERAGKQKREGRDGTPSVSKLTVACGRPGRGSDSPDGLSFTTATALRLPPPVAQGSFGRSNPVEKAERPEGGAREARKAGFNLGNHPGINGFVSIRCGGCGKVINTCLREKRTAFVCRGCGHETSLERVANIHMKCGRCGFTGKYRTNRTEEQITMECLSCSAIVPMKRVRRGNYVPEVEV